MPATPRKPIRPVTRALISKAKPDESWVALYDEAGTLIGITDPANITPVSGSSAPKQQAAPKAATATAADPQAALAKARVEALEIKKALYGGGLASDADRIAAQMAGAAERVLREIHKRPRGR